MLAIKGYRITEKVYESRNSLVYRGHRLEEDSPLIIKQLKEDYPSPDELTRYRQEYEITRELDAPGIIRALGQERYRNTLIIFLEDIGAHSLRILWHGRKVPLHTFLPLAIQAAGALGAIHDNHVVHKDINPSNMIYNPETGKLKIIDFGISTRLRRTTSNPDNPRNLEGTLAYLSPEQTGRMNRPVDYRTDFYSMGATFYELLCGCPPFEEDDPMTLVHCHIARRPTPPHEVDSDIPRVLSDIVMRCMEKRADRRYQSAWGLHEDLNRCLAQWQGTGHIAAFELGVGDILSNFQIPQKIYGREQELEALNAAFTRVLSGSTEMVCVAGYSGVGKTALIQELFKPLTRSGGFFISGKFDQFRGTTPCSAFINALNGLARRLLSEPEEKLHEWKAVILEAVGNNGRLITDAVPDMIKIIGEQPPLEAVDTTATRNRFLRTLALFIKAFCLPKQPLVLFLDDLQWADAVSMDLIEWLSMEHEDKPLLFVGAYRDNEVDESHPLSGVWRRISHTRIRLSTIAVKPLQLEDVGQFVADALHLHPEKVIPLRDLVFAKTGGNPFFTGQFLENLYEEELLTYTRVSGRGQWMWDDDAIQAKEFTDNLIELMVRKLNRQPPETRQLLQLAACKGNRFDLDTLAIISRQSVVETYRRLVPAVQEGYILPLSKLEVLAGDDKALITRHFKFCHDRVQQAAYQLIETERQIRIQYEIGRLLLANIDPEDLPSRTMEVVNHLNFARSLIREEPELRRLAAMNLEAGNQAMYSAAHVLAGEYFKKGLDCLGNNPWQQDQELCLALHQARIKVEMAAGKVEDTEALLAEAMDHVTGTLEKAELFRAYSLLYQQHGRYDDALENARLGLALLGVDLPDDPAAKLDELHHDMEEIYRDTDIYSLQPMDEASTYLAMTIIEDMYHTVYMHDLNLFDYLMVQCLVLTMQYGHHPLTVLAFSGWALLLKIRGDYEQAAVIGTLGETFCRHHGYSLVTPNPGYFLNLPIANWIRSSQVRYRNNLELGRFFSAGLLMDDIILLRHCWGRDMHYLADLDQYQTFAKTANSLSQEIIRIIRIINRNLCEPSPEIPFGSMAEESFTEPLQGLSKCIYYTFKAEVLLIQSRPLEALGSTRKAKLHLKLIKGTVYEEYHQWVHAMVVAAAFTKINPGRRDKAMAELEAVQKKWSRLEALNPSHFGYQHAMLQAERLRLLGRGEEALPMYRRAVQLAGAGEYTRHEALIHERIAAWWEALDYDAYARSHRVEAWQKYRQLGMKPKVSALESNFRDLARLTNQTLPKTLTTGTAGTSEELTLDIHTVVKAGQVISRNLRLEEMLKDMMTIVMENAGAERGFLVLTEDGKPMVRAYGEEEAGFLEPGIHLAACKDLCAGAVYYTAKSDEPLLLDDAYNEGILVNDPYIVSNKTRSLMCLPIHTRTRGLCVLYLENNLSQGAFTPQHQEVLQTLTAQMAISLENAMLYADIMEHNRTLEEKVAERTRELEAKNEAIIKAQQQLITQEKMASLGVLTAGVAHEINNPTNFAHGGAQNLERQLDKFREFLMHLAGDDSDEVTEALQTEMEPLFEQCDLIMEGTRRINRIVQDLRCFTRKDETPRITSGVSEALKSTVNLVRSNYHERISFHTDFQHPLVMECSPAELNQVFMNLIVNACDAIDERFGKGHRKPMGRIAVSTQSRNGHAVIKISDNGSGMTRETREKIFQPFYTTKPVGSGTGLGLSISYGIIQQHDGTIEVTSTPGEGSTFTIMLPIKLSGAPSGG
ncbi:MAG: AAA family ATPase [Acidobacteriota bacterium]|nr:AAA family ATPase [Acidobacteriota bacterium]